MGKVPMTISDKAEELGKIFGLHTDPDLAEAQMQGIELLCRLSEKKPVSFRQIRRDWILGLYMWPSILLLFAAIFWGTYYLVGISWMKWPTVILAIVSGMWTFCEILFGTSIKLSGKCEACLKNSKATEITGLFVDNNIALCPDCLQVEIADLMASNDKSSPAFQRLKNWVEEYIEHEMSDIMPKISSITGSRKGFTLE